MSWCKTCFEWATDWIGSPAVFSGGVVHPIKAFLDQGISDLKIINALDNLMPLDATENMCKNAKYDKEGFLNYLKNKGICFDKI